MEANRKTHFRVDDHKVVKIHDYFHSNHKYPLLIATVSLYMVSIVLWGEKFEVSSNYFIIIPVIVSALSFGLKGGIIAGILGLPANLFCFYLIGHMEYSPASLPMAELSGIILGGSLGYLSDFFTRLKEEMRIRQASERALEKSLVEKELLLQEINHRVKNNLNLIKSLIQLQNNRTSSEETQKVMKKMRDRIIAIAMVQDLLYSQDSLDELDFNTYTHELLSHLLEGFHEHQPEYTFNNAEVPIFLESRKVTSLGIIINEVVTNIMKYAGSDDYPIKIEVALSVENEEVTLIFKDNGPGYPSTMSGNGLGFKLIRTLLQGLEGHLVLRNDNGGELIVHFPL